jgi:hypothetical protein
MQSRMIEELARCTRLLALNIGHFQTHYGTLPRHEMIALLHQDEVDSEQARLLADGMQVLIGVLGSAVTHSTRSPGNHDR